MNKKLLLIWTFLLCFVMGMSADKVIVFNEGTGTSDSSTKLTAMSEIVKSGSENLTSITDIANVYLARAGRGLKLGASSKKGTMTLNLAAPCKPTAIKFKARQYNATEMNISVAGTEFPALTGDFAEYTVTFDGNTEVSSIAIATAAKRAYITEVTIVEAGGEQTTSAPTISGETPFFGTTTVTLACATEGAKIYYTLDGTDPTKESTEYTAPFSLDKTATVKAIAYDGDKASTVSTKEFVAAPTVATVADLVKLENNTAFQFSGELVVMAQPSAKYLYLKDETGSTLAFDASGEKFKFEAGQHITAGWQGKVSVYNGLFEVVPTTDLTAVADVKDEVVYDTKTAADVTVENANTVAWLKGVTYTAPEANKKNFTITEGEATVAGYNQFGITIAEPAEGRTYDILGIISRFNDNAQFQPIEIKRVAITANIEIAPETGADLATAIATAADGDKVGSLSITLAKGGEYTLSAPVTVAGKLSITGDATEPATIDASANAGAFILLNAEPEDILKGTGDYYIIGGENAITVSNVNVKGVKNQFIYDSNVQYCVEKMTVDNCTVTLASDETAVNNGGGIFSFKKGFINSLNIKNSTFWNNGTAEPKYFIAYASSGRCSRAGFEKNEVVLTNNTFYNVVKGGSMANYSGFNGQKTSFFTVKDNIFVDCGNGQVARRLLGSRTASSYAEGAVVFLNNTYMTNVPAAEGAEPTVEFESTDGYDVSETAIKDNPMFADAANGDFIIGAGTHQAYLKTGAPRWLVEFVGEDLTEIKNLLMNEIQKAMDLVAGAAEDDADANALRDAITIAKSAYNTAEFKADVQKAIDYLKAAEDTYQIAVAKTALNKLIDEANKLIADKADTEAGVAELKAAIDEAKAVADNAEASADDLKAAAEKLQTAIDAFKLATSIDGVNAENADNNAWYTLQGVKVNKALKGIFIHNGKKVVLK